MLSWQQSESRARAARALFLLLTFSRTSHFLITAMDDQAAIEAKMQEMSSEEKGQVCCNYNHRLSIIF